MGKFSALETLKKKNHSGSCLSCKNFYKEGNCEICLKTDKFIIPEFRPYNCKNWSNKMENADKMLSGLGYMCMYKDEENIVWTLYGHDYKYEIDFKLKYKEVLYRPIFRETEEILDNGGVTMQELQAIYEKCKELGWL